jgi:hypothetical protein
MRRAFVLFALAVALLASAEASAAAQRSLTVAHINGSGAVTYEITAIQFSLSSVNGRWSVMLIARSGALHVNMTLYSASNVEAFQLHRNLLAIYASNLNLGVTAYPSVRDERNKAHYSYQMANERDGLVIMTSP